MSSKLPNESLRSYLIDSLSINRLLGFRKRFKCGSEYHSTSLCIHWLSWLHGNWWCHRCLWWCHRCLWWCHFLFYYDVSRNEFPVWVKTVGRLDQNVWGKGWSINNLCEAHWKTVINMLDLMNPWSKLSASWTRLFGGRGDPLITCARHIEKQLWICWA